MERKSVEREILENREKDKNIKEEKVNLDVVGFSIKNRFSKFTSKFDNLKIKYKKDPKKYALLLSSLILGFSLVIGSSYAYLTYISKTDNITLINAGTLALTFKNESNSIYLDNVFPMSDNEGLLLDKEYEFTIENTGDIPANYKLTLDNTCVVGKSYTIDGNSFTSDKCVPNEYIKVGLKAEDGEYKVLEGPYQSGQKGEAEVVGAAKDPEGMIFDGNDYVNLGHDNYDFTDKITIGARFKANEVNNGDTVRYIFSNIESGGFAVYIAPQTNKIGFLIYSEGLQDYVTMNSDVVAEVGKWYTFISVYDGSVVKSYVNGVLVNSYEYSDISVVSSQPFFVGANPNATGKHDRFFKGVVSDILLTNDILSEDDITSNFSEEFTYRVDDKTLVYKKWSEIDDYILDAGVLNANQNLSYKMKIWLDYDTPNDYNSQGSLNVIYSGKLGLSYEQAINLDKSGANYPKLSSAMIPVYYDDKNDVWRKADEYNSDRNYKWYDYDKKMWANAVTYDHTKVVDLSSANNHGNINGAVYTEDGVRFDGIDDYVVAGNSSYDFGNKLTVAARFKVNKIPDSAGMYIVGNAQSGGFLLEVATTGQACFRVYGVNSPQYNGVCTTETLDVNKWYTAVGVYDGTNTKIYMDGDEKSVDYGTDTINVSPMPVCVGANPNANNSYEQIFNGYVSDALVINDVLTSSEINDNFNNDFNYQEYDNTLFYYNLKGYEGRLNGTEIPMDMINTMLVWVPRYKYNVWNYNLDGTVTSEPQEIQITFEKGANSTGDITCTDNIQGTSDGTSTGTAPTTSEICKINNTNCTDSSCKNKTYTHPAFTFGDKELTGIWVGKFELSSDKSCNITDSASSNQEGTCNINTITPLIKPNVTSWRGAMVSTFENNLMLMNDSGNKYGFASSDDTHMIKNMEWGAVAYLSHSKYGKNQKVILNSTETYTTGCGPQSEGSTSSGSICNAYNTSLGKTSSTTGNIYGIYDMSGGSYEYVMGNTVSIDGKQMLSGYRANSSYPNEHSGYDGILYYNGTTAAGYGIYDGAYSYPDNRYIDKYSFNTDYSLRSISKLGDGIKETYNTSSYGWYDNYSYLSYSRSPWFYRGGYYNNGDNVSVFNSANADGSAHNRYSSRLVISQ